MGDWAKGEFINEGKVPGTDFLYFRVPGSAGMVSFNSDQFAMFNVTSPQAQAAQALMASDIMSPAFQTAFNSEYHAATAAQELVNAVAAAQ